MNEIIEFSYSSSRDRFIVIREFFGKRLREFSNNVHIVFTRTRRNIRSELYKDIAAALLLHRALFINHGRGRGIWARIVVD